MNDRTQERVARALDAYATALDRLQPSPQLDARMQAAIQRELSKRNTPRWRIHAWALAASVTVVASIGAIIWARSPTHDAVAPQQASTARNGRPATTGDVMVFPSGAVSLWPTEATVFRVRSNFGASGAEQQYWLDVRMGNDGSMRIERVLSADGSELFARPGLDQQP